MLTTTSGVLPSTIYNRIKANPEKVHEVVGRIEVQHGNILEHNRLVWRLDATREEVLGILLRSKFFDITDVGDGAWALSCDLRTIVEYHQEKKDEFSELLVESIKDVTPQIYSYIRRTVK